MAFARQLMSATKRNTVNTLTATQAEAMLVANGWVAGANMTPSAGSTVGPFGFGTGTLLTTNGAARSLRFVSGTFGVGGARVSVFVKAGGSTTAFSLGLSDETNALIHYVTFNYSGGVWTAGGTGLGAVGFVHPTTYDNGWTRLQVEFTPGSAGGGATASGSSLAFWCQPTPAAQTCETWGAMIEPIAATNSFVPTATQTDFQLTFAVDVEANLVVTETNAVPAVDWAVITTNTTGPIVRFVTAADPTGTHTFTFVRRNDVATPYLSGLKSLVYNDGRYIAGMKDMQGGVLGVSDFVEQELPLFRPQRVKDENGTFYTEWLNTPSGAMKLQGRSDPSASWFDLVSITQANLNGSGQYAALVALMPEMRVVLPTVGNTTVTFTAWIDE